MIRFLVRQLHPHVFFAKVLVSELEFGGFLLKVEMVGIHTWNPKAHQFKIDGNIWKCLMNHFLCKDWDVWLNNHFLCKDS